MNEKQNFTEGKHTVEDGVVEFYDNAVCEVRGGKARGAEKRWGMSDKIKKCPLRKDAPKTIKAQYDPNKVLPMACPICRQNAHSSEMYLTAPDGKSRLNVLYYYACYTCSMPEMIELRHTDQAAIAEWNNWVKKYLEAQKEGGE